VSKRAWVGLVLMVLVACSPAAQGPSVQVLPTVAALPSPTPETFTLDSAERVARLFLDAWSRSDFSAMYQLVIFAGREATTQDEFTTLYQNATQTMSLKELEYTIHSQMLDSNQTMVFSYDVTFITDLLGTFTDSNRTLRLAFDSQVGDWRVAWSPGNIFAAMGGGGQLRLEPRIPSRANIYDSEGRVLADQNARVITVSVVKQNIPAFETCLARLSVAMNKPGEDIRTILDARAPNWLAEVGTIEPVTYLQMHDQLEQDCNAQFRERPARRYPDGAASANIIGYVGYPSEAQVPTVEAAGFPKDAIIGQSGIEASWDETLRGKPGGRLVVQQPNGEQTVIAEGASQPSESLWLTLDSDLQHFTERAIARAYASASAGWGSTSKGASAVVMDPNTGVILAMVSYPTFDNNAFTPFPTMGRANADRIVQQVQEDDRRPQLNRPTLGIYPAGSIFKVVPAIAAADSGLYEFDHRYNSTGIWNRDIPRYDWLSGGHGLLTLPGFLKHSCNSCFYETGYDLDNADPFRLPNYARRLGLGGVTGLRDLPEAAGTIIDPDIVAEQGGTWSFSNAVNMAIGQGEVQITPLQIVRLYASIANGGTLYRPQLVQRVGILGESPSYVMTPDPMAETGIDPAVLNLIHNALCTVTSEQGGTAEHIFRRSPLQSLVVCGKTGTAQAPGEGSLPHAWFVAYAPKDKPEIAVVVMVENSGDGSAVAAPITKEIMEYYFFGIDPDAAVATS
jgi:penicillin-binding protein 2